MKRNKNMVILFKKYFFNIINLYFQKFSYEYLLYLLKYLFFNFLIYKFI